MHNFRTPDLPLQTQQKHRLFANGFKYFFSILGDTNATSDIPR